MSLARPCAPLAHGAARRLLPVLMLSLPLCGCTLPLMQPPPEEPVRSYILEWRDDTAPPGRVGTGPVLLVSPILSASGFDGSDMAYMRMPHEIEYFARHRWVDAPARMLEPLLVAAAERSGLFRSVAETGSGVDADLRLDSKLVHLQQVCRPEPSALQLELRVTLVKLASAEVLASRTLSVSEPLAKRTPYAGVEAANRAVARLMWALQEFLAEQLQAPRR